MDTDTRSEDTMVRQIEKNLSNQMSENLFLTGRTIEENKLSIRKKGIVEKTSEAIQGGEAVGEYPLVSNDYISDSPGITRAEYIRQAREACLRQLSATQVYSRPYDINYMSAEAGADEQLSQKKANVMKLFRNGTEENAVTLEHNRKELLSYRSLVIRSFCAIVLFLSVFLIDKFNVNIGKFSNDMIQEYVTGNDALEQLENILVTWLK